LILDEVRGDIASGGVGEANVRVDFVGDML